MNPMMMLPEPQRKTGETHKNWKRNLLEQAAAMGTRWWLLRVNHSYLKHLLLWDYFGLTQTMMVPVLQRRVEMNHKNLKVDLLAQVAGMEIHSCLLRVSLTQTMMVQRLQRQIAKTHKNLRKDLLERVEVREIHRSLRMKLAEKAEHSGTHNYLTLHSIQRDLVMSHSSLTQDLMEMVVGIHNWCLFVVLEVASHSYFHFLEMSCPQSC